MWGWIIYPLGAGDGRAAGLPARPVEGQLLPVDIQPAYDRHRDLLTLRRGARAPLRELLTKPIVTRLSWGGPYDARSDRASSTADGQPADACHLICTPTRA